jgi:hypothetical protein
MSASRRFLFKVEQARIVKRRPGPLVLAAHISAHAAAHLRVVGDAHYVRRHQRLMRLNWLMIRLMFGQCGRDLHPGAQQQLTRPQFLSIFLVGASYIGRLR